MKYRTEYLFCGGCNPLYDRNHAYKTLRVLLEEQELSTDSAYEEIIIIFNGCQCGCIRGPKGLSEKVKVINIQQYITNHRGNLSLDGIISWVLQQIK